MQQLWLCWLRQTPVHLVGLLHLLPLLPMAHLHTPTALSSCRPWRYWQHALGLRLAQRMLQKPEHGQKPLPPPSMQPQQMRSQRLQPIVRRPWLMHGPMPVSLPLPLPLPMPMPTLVLVRMQRPTPTPVPLPTMRLEPKLVRMLTLTQKLLLTQQISSRWLVAAWKQQQLARSPPGQ